MAKSKYKTHVEPRLNEIEKWISENTEIKVICERLGISKSSYFLYLGNNKDFSDAVKKGEELRPVILTNSAKASLLKIIEGYEIEEQEIEVWKDATGNTSKQHIKKKKKYIPPNATAIIFALKNNDSEHYYDRTGSITNQSLEIEKQSKQIELLEAQIERQSMSESDFPDIEFNLKIEEKDDDQKSH